MASAQMSRDASRPSFAKVAASVPKERVPASSQRRALASNDQPTIFPLPREIISTGVSNNGHDAVAAPPQGNLLDPGEKTANVGKIAHSLADLSLSAKAPSLVLNGSGSASAERTRPLVSRESGSEDSQRADSSSELGTKPPSLDGKSITSGTTFALDEKESLRPDDSASVKAAAEDDDVFSLRGSLIAGSRMGSEVAARARAIPMGEVPERRLAQASSSTGIQGILTPQSASESEQQSSAGPPMALTSVDESSDALNVIYRQAPDDKLIEAMATPRDRYFLLRLEKDVIDFVQNSKEPYMDLPPSNSFCRMLTHKLADYYHMTHSYEPHIGSVRIFRTPFCRVPPSLALMQPEQTVSNSSTPPPAVLPRKIMRRAQDGDPGTASASPSKPTSEVGSDGKEKQPVASQKLTREEREELYKLARERIFGNSEEVTTDTDGDNGISRASSVSANRSALGKRGKTGKQRRDDSDSFDSRHQYTPYWGTQQQTWVSQSQYIASPEGQMSPSGVPPYSGQMAPVPYGQQGGGYAAGMPAIVPNAAYPPYPLPQYQQQPAPQRFQPGGSPMAAYGSPMPPAGPQQSWPPSFSQAQYVPRGPAPPGPPGQPGLPYAFGQLPSNINPHDPKSQHPIPGSYNRNHNFNPKTQSFVPGGTPVGTGILPPVQPPQPPYTAPVSHHGSPQIGSPHLAFPGYQQAMPQPYGGGYGMARQASNNSMTAYHPQQHGTPPHAQLPPPVQIPQHGPVQHQNQPAHTPPRPNHPQGQAQIFSHLPTYGNPATLPQKPATGI